MGMGEAHSVPVPLRGGKPRVPQPSRGRPMTAAYLDGHRPLQRMPKACMAARPAAEREEGIEIHAGSDGTETEIGRARIARGAGSRRARTCAVRGKRLSEVAFHPLRRFSTAEAAGRRHRSVRVTGHKAESETDGRYRPGRTDGMLTRCLGVVRRPGVKKSSSVRQPDCPRMTRPLSSRLRWAVPSISCRFRRCE